MTCAQRLTFYALHYRTPGASGYVEHLGIRPRF